jgi:hypothetical protein
MEFFYKIDKILNREILMKKFFLMFLLIAITVLVFSDEIDEARELLAAEEGGEIIFLSKINLGIPGGENWIADRSDSRTGIYTISNDKEVEYIRGMLFAEQSDEMYWDRSRNTYINLEYDIMHGIPGTRIGNKTASFGDFNGDGKDEIFEINPYLAHCSIYGFDIESDKRAIKITPYKELTDIWSGGFDFISSSGPSPIFFTRYQGRDGFLIHYRDFLANRFSWVFFVWDEESRKYVELIEIPADKIDWSMFPSEKDEDSRNNNEPALVNNVISGNEEENAFEKTTASTPPDNGKSTKSIFYIVIIAAIAVLAAVVVFIVLRMKKK